MLQETDRDLQYSYFEMVSNVQKHTKLMLVALGNMFLVLFIVMTTIVRIQCVFKANLRKIFAPIQGDLQLLQLLQLLLISSASTWAEVL